MWRFLNNIFPRAVKNYHYPRASCGVYVDSDDKEQEPTDLRDREQTCVDQVSRQNTSHTEDGHVLNNDAIARARNIFWRFFALEGKDQHEGLLTKDGEHDQQYWWKCWQKDVCAFVHGSNGMLQKISAGSSFIFRSKHERQQKSDIIYQILFSICGSDDIVKSVNGQDVESVKSKKREKNVLAIKDIQGAEQDRALNGSKPETLEEALKSFEHMCTDYSAKNESLLALLAFDKGDESEAVKHFHLSCSLGNKTACFNLGQCYETGTGVAMDLDKSKHYYGLAVAKGHSQAMYNLSLIYLNEDNNESQYKGMDLMEMAAREGLAQAQTQMGIHHMQVTGDAKSAAACFRAAASQNDSEALYCLAICHEHGLGVMVNECRAAHLYSQGAILKHDGAIYNLGRFHEHGFGGIPRDQVTAHNLYVKAAELGNEDAKFRLEQLDNLKQNKEQITNVSVMEDQVFEKTPSQCTHPSNPINPSLSSPSLGGMDEPFTTKDSFKQTLYRFIQRIRGQSWFDPGGSIKNQIIKFYVGQGDGQTESDVSIEKMEVNNEMHHNGTHQCKTIHKSSTTPDLSTLYSCNTVVSN